LIQKSTTQNSTNYLYRTLSFYPQTMTQHALLGHLEDELREVLDFVRTQIAAQPDEVMRHRPDTESWNGYECFAHLNALSDAYLSRIELAIHKAKARKWLSVEPLRYTARGRRAIRRADPANTKKYKSAKRYNFSHQPVGPEQVKAFSIHVERMLRLIQQAREVDLNKATIRKAHSWVGEYTLGNLLEYLVKHTLRHVGQVRIV
ncbi:MAG TPA: DinB family protein, partial [Saprospiraceae bacterium]|nr:DinB family protein [Saprospiraceae bacterium]